MVSVVGSKQEKNRFKQRCKKFGLVDNLIYLKTDVESYRQFFVEEMTIAMKLELQIFIRQNYYGHNRLYKLCKQVYFSIPRVIVKEVCAECNICAQAQPFKQESNSSTFWQADLLKG